MRIILLFSFLVLFSQHFTNAQTLWPSTPGQIGTFTTQHYFPGLDTTTTPVSLAYLNPVAAGSDGQIISAGGHLWVNSNRIRLYGINMPSGAFIPLKSEAPLIAANLKKQGFNAVRLIGFDRLLFTPNTYTVTYHQQGILNTDHTLNTQAMDAFDYFVYQLQQNGIYIEFPIHATREYLEASGLCKTSGCEGLDEYLPVLIQSQKDFAKLFLNHFNPYTCYPYKNDPGVFAIEINNENSLSQKWSSGIFDLYIADPATKGPFTDPLKELFSRWAQNKYGSITSLNAAWAQSCSSFSDITVPLSANKASMTKTYFKDWVDFIAETETGYFNSMYHFLKDTIGVTSLVYGTQTGYTAPFVQDLMDINDVHTYYKTNPVITSLINTVNNRPVFQVVNTSMLESTDIWNAGIIGTNGSKSPTKPNIITEYCYRDFNDFIAEQEPVMAMYAGFQDMDAIFLFNYHGMNLNTNAQTYPGMYNMTVNLLTRFSSALSFRRGDVTPGVPVILKKTRQTYLDSAGSLKTYNLTNYHFGGDIRAPFTKNLYYQTVASSSLETSSISSIPPTSGTFVNSTGEIKWKKQDRLTLKSPLTQVAIGYFRNINISLGDSIEVAIGNTMNNYAVVSMTSLNNNQRLPSDRMLFTIAGYFDVPGEWPRQPGQIGIDSASWGTSTPRIELVPSTVRIHSSRVFKVSVLSSTGKITGTVPVTKTGNVSQFDTGYPYDSGWFLVETVVTPADTTHTDPPTGVETETKQITFNVFPNPNSGEFFIRASRFDATTKLEVYNNSGKLIINQPITESLTKLNIKDQVSGIYHIRILNQQNGIEFRSKIIKK